MGESQIMHISIFAKNSPSEYSGGRIYSWMLAEATAFLGHKVSYITNNRPIFYNDFKLYSNHSDIKLFITHNFKNNLPKIPADIVIIVPGSDYRWIGYDYYLKALYFASINKSRIIFINFESGNWANSVSISAKPMFYWDNWKRCTKYCDLILSSSKIGNQYAKDFYLSCFNKPIFDFCYPPINSKVADKEQEFIREKKIVIINRFSSKYKNATGVINIIDKYLSGYEIIFIVGSGDIPNNFFYNINKKAKKFNIHVQFEKKITDSQKFKIIKKSKLLLFLSSFEGFGAPPIEALYCGTPCIAFELPVLREVSGNAIEFVPQGDYSALRDKIYQVLNEKRYNSKHLRERVESIAKLEKFATRLSPVYKKALHRELRSMKNLLLIYFDRVLFSILLPIRLFLYLYSKKGRILTKLKSILSFTKIKYLQK